MLGHNNPPPDELTPFEIAAKAVNDICDEAALWLDGMVIDSQELADGVGNLLAGIRKAEKLADEARKKEREPYDEAIKEIQARYAPLIGDTKAVRGKTVLAAEACKAALQPWLVAQDRRIKEEARLARERADKQRQEAAEALKAAEARNLAEREAADLLVQQAQQAERAALLAAKKTATAGGTFGRAAGLRTTWVATIDDPVLAARTCWKEGREEMLVFLQQWATQQVRLGRRTLPGFTISEQKVAT